MQRILNITHDDLDGIVASIAIANAHPSDHVTVRFATYGDVNQQLKRGFKAALPYDRIILSDISVKTPADINDKTPDADLIRELRELAEQYVSNGGEFVVLDHHATALSMQEGYQGLLHRESILEVEDADGIKRAGSELAARYLKRRADELSDDLQGYMEMSEAFEELGWSMADEETMREHVYKLCEIAGDYDTWRDPLGFGGRLALAVSMMDDVHGAHTDLNDLLHIAFHDDEGNFEEALMLVPNLGYYYDEVNEKLEERLRATEEEAVAHHPRFHQIQTELFPNECAMNLYDKTHGVVMVQYPNNPRRMSFRRHPSCDVDLGDFCARFGRGGGHAAAAGVTLAEGVSIEEVVAAMRTEVERIPHV